MTVALGTLPVAGRTQDGGDLWTARRAAAERALDRAERWLHARSWAQLAGLALGITALVHGLWLYPVVPEILEFSRDLTGDPLAGRQEQFVYWSLLGPWLGHATRTNGGAWSFAGLQLALLVGLGGLALLGHHRRHGDAATRRLTLLLFTSPVLAVCTTWLGSADVVTLVVSIAWLALDRRPLAAALVGVVAGVNHFEQSMLIAAGLGVVGLVDARDERGRAARWLALALIGVVVGRALVLAHFHHYDIEPTTTRFSFVERVGLRSYAHATFGNPLWTLLSVYGLGWLPVLVLAACLPDRRLVRVWGLIHLGLVPILVLTLDQTRVAALLLLPVLLRVGTSEAASRLHPRDARRLGRAVALTALLAVVVPRVVVWDGRLHSSVAYDTLVFGLEKLGVVEDRHSGMADPFHGRPFVHASETPSGPDAP